jgi:hypothetical protein
LAEVQCREEAIGMGFGHETKSSSVLEETGSMEETASILEHGTAKSV